MPVKLLTVCIHTKITICTNGNFRVKKNVCYVQEHEADYLPILTYAKPASEITLANIYARRTTSSYHGC